MPDRTTTIRPAVVENISEVQWKDGDVAVFATKLQDTLPLMDALREHAGGHVPVVCASNGVQGERWACDRFECVISMLIWMPATHLEPGEVNLYTADCRGVLDNGPADCRDTESAANLSERLCGWLNTVGFDAVSRDDIHRWKHAKWITNLGNAAQALVSDDWKTIAKMAQAEGEQILSAADVERVPTRQLLDRCQSVMEQPIDGEDRPGGSSWQSFQRGQRMETEWLEGAMADLAQKIGVPSPVNSTLRRLAAEGRVVSATEFIDAISQG